jgi:hypothetical protein
MSTTNQLLFVPLSLHFLMYFTLEFSSIANLEWYHYFQLQFRSPGMTLVRIDSHVEVLLPACSRH